MIHIKRTRLNASHLPDDYDEDKLIQSYEDNFLYIITPIRELPDFFTDLGKKYPNEMSSTANSYFSYTFPNGPINPDFIRTEIHGTMFSFRYWIKKGATESNEEIEAVAEQNMWEWINSYESDSTRYRVANYLTRNICKLGEQAAEGEFNPYEFNEFMDKIASALGVNPNRFIQHLIDTNNLAAVDFNDTDIESDIFDKLYHEYTDNNAMIIACINTAPYTGFKPHNL